MADPCYRDYSALDKAFVDQPGRKQFMQEVIASLQAKYFTNIYCDNHNVVRYSLTAEAIAKEEKVREQAASDAEKARQRKMDADGQLQKDAEDEKLRPGKMTRLERRSYEKELNVEAEERINSAKKRVERDEIYNGERRKSRLGRCC